MVTAGSKAKVAGAGMPNQKTAKRGDVVVVFDKVEFPKKAGCVGVWGCSVYRYTMSKQSGRTGGVYRYTMSKQSGRTGAVYRYTISKQSGRTSGAYRYTMGKQ